MKLTIFCKDEAQLQGNCGALLKTTLSKFDVEPTLIFGDRTAIPLGVPVLALDKGAQQELGLTTQERWELLPTGQWAIGGIFPTAVLYEPTKAVHFINLIDKATQPNLGWIYPPTRIEAIDDPYPLPNLNQDFGRICVDIETTSKEWRDPKGYIFLVGILTERGECWILTRPYLEKPETQTWLRALFTQHGPRIGGHNFKFDVLFLHREFGIPLTVGWDTISMVNTYHESWHKGLKELATFYFDADDYETRLVKPYLGKGKTYEDVPYPQMREYLLCDLGYNLVLSFELEALLKEVGRWEMPYLGHEIPQVNLLTEVEANGFAVDLARIDMEIAAMQVDADKLKAQVIELSEGHIQNPGSKPQVGNYLFNIMGKKVTRRTAKKKAPSVVEEILVEHRDIPAIAALLAWNRVTKLLSSYLVNIKNYVYQDKFGVDRVHPNWKHWNVITHRLSAEAPAIQTIPHKDAKKDTLPQWLFDAAGLEMREGFEVIEDGVIADYGTTIKSVYVAAPGNVLITMDGSGWEMTVCAGWSKDPYLTERINANISVHTEICDDMYGQGQWTKAQRVKEKNVYFGWQFCGSVNAFVMETGLPRYIVQRIVDYLNTHCGGVVAWQKEMLQQAKTGSIKIPFFNYEIHFDLITERVLKDLGKNAANYPIQGAGSMLISRAAYLAQPYLWWLGGAGIVALVHDDYTVEAPPHYAYYVAKTMAKYLEVAGKEFNSNIAWNAEFKIGPNWATQKELTLEQIKQQFGE